MTYGFNDERADLKTRIAETERQKAELEKALKRLNEMSPNKRLATFLHSKFCKSNHTDGCSWYYGENDWNMHPHPEYLLKADQLLTIMPEAQIVAICNILEPHRPFEI